jgi:uncharacterized membrane protein YqjE
MNNHNLPGARVPLYVIQPEHEKYETLATVLILILWLVVFTAIGLIILKVIGV